MLFIMYTSALATLHRCAFTFDHHLEEFARQV